MFSEPCTPYQNHHHQLTMEIKRAGSDGKSLPAVSNGMSNIKLTYNYGARACYLIIETFKSEKNSL